MGRRHRACGGGADEKLLRGRLRRVGNADRRAASEGHQQDRDERDDEGWGTDCRNRETDRAHCETDRAADTQGLLEARAKKDPAIALKHYLGTPVLRAPPGQGARPRVMGPGPDAKWKPLSMADVDFEANWDFQAYAGDVVSTEHETVWWFGAAGSSAFQLRTVDGRSTDPAFDATIVLKRVP